MPIDKTGGLLDSWGVAKTVQSAQNGGLVAAMGGGSNEHRRNRTGIAEADQFLGKWGPMIGEWSAEFFAMLGSEF